MDVGDTSGHGEMMTPVKSDMAMLAEGKLDMLGRSRENFEWG